MRIYKIFRSIQGETTRAGLPMWFVRLSGCDLRCAYCDTPEARNGAAGRDMPLQDILAAIDDPPLPWCVVTGGEPLLQLDDVNVLVEALSERGRGVLVETSGAHPTDRLHPAAHIILDLKAPGSRMDSFIHWPNLERLRPEDEIKIVLSDRADYDWAARQVRERPGLERVPVLLAPAAGRLDPKTLARWILEDALPVRLGLQLHKLLDLP